MERGGDAEVLAQNGIEVNRLLKSSHIAAVLVASLCGVALLRLRVRSCGCDDLTAFEQPERFKQILT